MIKPLVHTSRAEKKSGNIKIIGDEKTASNNEELLLTLDAHIGNSNMSFFIVNKFISPEVYKPIYKSETKVATNGSHKWNMVNLLTSELANDDVEREIRIEFFESAKSGKHVNRGFASFNLA